METLKIIFRKATVQPVAALMLTGTACYMAVVGTVSPDAFLGAVVGGAFVWLFGSKASA